MERTRKLPVGHDPKKPTRKLGHMVPKFVLGIEGAGFVSVDSEKEAEIGRVVYLGCDVSSADIVAKMKKKGPLLLRESEVIQRLDRFLQLLREFKIGYLVKAEVSGGEFSLVLVSTFSALSKPVPLP